MSEFKSWNSYRAFANHIRRQNRFIRRAEDDSFLREVLRTSAWRVRDFPEDFPLWRAQLGHDWRSDHDDACQVPKLPAAYVPDRMKPLEGRAAEGRANPKGIPVLYLATRQETAMSEVRPWVGSLVSCAQFATTRPLRIVDFSVNHGKGTVRHFSEPNSSQKEEAVWTHIDQAFSEPVTSADDTADYAPTQVIAELFKNEGFDGIAYKSVFGEDGYNIALYRLADAELTTCALHEVKSLASSFEQFDNPYWRKSDGRIKTISVEIVGPADRDDDSTS